MAIKAGSIIHDAHGFVIDRIQSAGVPNLNIPEETVYELGNFESVGRIRDTPDLSFDMESFDVSTEIEALATFTDPTTTISGDMFDLSDSVPMDIISPMKPGYGNFSVSKGIVIPFLTLESSTYRFGVTDNATQQHTFRGDSYFYVPGSPRYEEFDGDGVTSSFVFEETAIPYLHAGDTLYALGVSVVFDDGSYRRLFYGEHYTNTANGITILNPATNAPVDSVVRVVYGTTTPKEYPQTVHENDSIKPVAVRGKDIDVYVGTADATPVFSRWTSVTSFEVSRRVTLDQDREFGNAQVVSQDYDVPEVTGSITVRPQDLDDLWGKVHQVANVPSNEVVGVHTSAELPMELRVHDPQTGVRVKTFYIPDARFTIPGIQGQVQQKAEVTFNFNSEGGKLEISKGNRYGT